ncbi:MAG: TonB-dependent receptor, partial [Gammaproteobacteria bacterium]|nr:TonB-dependent receptor [Gammaproteobacteria bacterium]
MMIRRPELESAASLQECAWERSFRIVTCLAALVGVAMTLAPAGAAAQQSSQGATGLEEVVVTATKRTTTLQETPISIAAVSGDDIVREGIPDINSLMEQIPGVALQTVGPGRTNFTMRGMSGSGGSSPTVGYYLDDIPVTPATSAISSAGKSLISPDIYDLQRVEVLRGPQGTLYGSGSEGGTIRLLMNQPQLDKFQATAQTAFSETARGDTLNYNLNGMLNVPIADHVAAFRLVATEKYDGGYIDRVVVSPFPSYINVTSPASCIGNVVPQLPPCWLRGNVAAGPVVARHADVNYARTEAVRGLLLFQPSDALAITPSVFYQRLTQGGQNSYDLPPGNFAHYQAGDVPERFEESFYVYALSIKYSTDAIALSSTTSQLNTYFYNQEDVDEQWYGFFVTYGTPFITTGDGWERHDQRQFSEELRLTSNGNGPLQWLLGGFYNDFKDQLSFLEQSPQLIAPDGTSNVFTDYEPDHLKQEAAFGEATYAITPTFKATAGLRYFHYAFDFLQDYSGLATAPPLSSTGSNSASGTTPKVGVTYLPDENLTVFASATKGFRPGGANLPIPPSFCGASLQSLGIVTYAPDSVWSYELGEKARLAGGALAIRASAYYIDWKNVQQNIPLACGFDVTENAGAAVSKGGELEIDARLGSAFTVHGTVGYTDAKITQAIAGSALAVGARLPNVPEWTASGSLEYTTNLTPGWDFSARAD